MGILDEAIREHLELKRQHGASESELDELEKDAFGPAERPGTEPSDQLSEAPTEFMAQPEDEAPEMGETGAGPTAREEAAARIAGLQEAPEATEQDRAEDEESQAEDEPQAEAPGSSEEPHVEASGPSTEEREVIAEQPTEHFDVVAAGEAEDEPEPVHVEEEEDDFFDERRLSEELDQALEGPSGTAEEVTAPAEETAAEHAVPSTSEPDESEAEEPEQPAEPEQGQAEQPEAQSADEDVLEETPDFLEESPEDDELWFEQKPPKDFDFDD